MTTFDFECSEGSSISALQGVGMQKHYSRSFLSHFCMFLIYTEKNMEGIMHTTSQDRCFYKQPTWVKTRQETSENRIQTLRSDTTASKR